MLHWFLLPPCTDSQLTRSIAGLRWNGEQMTVPFSVDVDIAMADIKVGCLSVIVSNRFSLAREREKFISKFKMGLVFVLVFSTQLTPPPL